jgi:uncharacterized protein
MKKILPEYYGKALFTNYSYMMNDRSGRYCVPHAIAYILVLVGALNWGLVGLGGYMGVDLNLVHLLLGSWPMIEWLVYILVGLSAVFMLFQGSCSYCHSRDYSPDRNKSMS